MGRDFAARQAAGIETAINRHTSDRHLRLAQR
jgi:hypothetical protein